MSSPKDVVLGFYEKAKSSLILTPEFTPSKIGGMPVSFWLFLLKIRPGFRLWGSRPSGARNVSTKCRF